MARPNPLADPDFAQDVAEAFAAGTTRKDMCEMFGRSDPDTITRWRRDPRVATRLRKIVEERVLSVTRRVDGIIEQKLTQAADELTIQELLAIRKEFGLSNMIAGQAAKADDATINEAMIALESNPNLVDQLDELLANASKAEAAKDAEAA